MNLKVKSYYRWISQIIFPQKLLINFINKIKHLNRIKPYIKFLGLKISLDLIFPLNCSYFFAISQNLGVMDLKVGFIKTIQKLGKVRTGKD